MASFVENAAGSEIQQPPAQNPVNIAPAAGNDGASGVHAPPSTQAPAPTQAPPVSEPAPVSVYRPEGVVVSGPAPAMTAAEVVSQFAQQSNGGEGSNGSAAKRRRGRPRKYAPAADGVAVAASPVSAIAVQSQSGGSIGGSGAGGSQGSLGKRGRGRPVGSRGRPCASVVYPFDVSPDVAGLPGFGFMPHVVIVQPGMDVYARLMSFSQVSSQAVVVMSANGSIASVTLQQSSSSGGTVSYEGRFDILSIVGSFLLSEAGGQRSRTGGLSVTLAGPDGSIFGGGLAGLLIAASPVQLILGTFIASQQATRPGYNDTAPQKNVASVGGSPPSRATLSESSGGPVSPFNNSAGGCNNSSQQNVPNVAWN